MSNFLMSVVREIAQKLVGVAALWLIAHGIDVPDAVTNWAILAIVAGALAGWTALVRFLETRDPATPLGRAARFIARILMLGISAKPRYSVAVPNAREVGAPR